MKYIIVNEILIPSLHTLYKIDSKNIENDVSERNICARLAHHMENIMREYDKKHKTQLFTNYYVDVEYNRMGKGNPKQYEDREHKSRYMVSDLLIQSRETGRNYLAVEMKKKGNKKNIDSDIKRLKSLVSHGERIDCVHDTLLGALIIYDSKKVDMKLYYLRESEIVEKPYLLFL